MHRDYPAIRRYIEAGNPRQRAGPTSPPATTSDPGDLTPKQRAVYLAIYESARDLGYQPALRDLVKRFGLSSSNAMGVHLRALVRKRWLAPPPDGGPRSQRILRRPDGSPFAGFADKD